MPDQKLNQMLSKNVLMSCHHDLMNYMPLDIPLFLDVSKIVYSLCGECLHHDYRIVGCPSFQFCV
jgi:hypothetical protein